MSNLRPLGARAIVRRLEAEEKTAGGIIIPDSAKEKPTQGEVIAVGAGERCDSGELCPMNVSTGDIVLFKKWGAEDVKVDGEELLIVKEDDILAVVEKGSTVSTDSGHSGCCCN